MRGEDTNKVNLLGSLGRELWNNEPFTALDHFQKALALAERLGWVAGMAQMEVDIGYVYSSPLSNYPEAIVHLNQSIKHATKAGDDGIASEAYFELGYLYLNLKDSTRCVMAFKESLAAASKDGHHENANRATTWIGNAYLIFGRAGEAMRWYEQARSRTEATHDTLGLAFAHENIAAAHQIAGNDTLALRHLTINEDLLALAHSDYRTLRVLSQKAELYQKIGDNAKAFKCLERMFVLAQKLGDKERISRYYSDLGRYHGRLNDWENAVADHKNALRIAQEISNLDVAVGVLDELVEALRKAKRYKEALSYFDTLMIGRDSLEATQGKAEVVLITAGAEYDKQQLADSLAHANEVAQLEKDRTIQRLRADRNRNNALALMGGAILVMGGGTFFFISDRRRRRERFEKDAAQLETRALRSQMNPHFIFNALNSINAYVQKNDQDSASSYLTKFARVMRSVLENSRHSEVPLKDDLETLRGYMDLERKRMQEKFDFTITVDDALDPEEVVVPPLVVQPFVENAIWHGIAGKEGKGHISLKVEARGKQLVWIIEDNGVGRNAKKEPAAQPPGDTPTKKTSLGTAITRSRLDLVQKQHGGTAGFRYVDVPQGTRVEVEMPLMHAH
ncbi:MAG: tetratricopeptide repeat protein [Flavobacteriales bacterium]|nr:tetratricopeptide repeat protein [Flavobacteriales bacterium]